MQILESARLRLRPMVEDDASFLVALLNEPAFLRHIGDKGVRTVEDARHYMAGPQDSFRKHGFGLGVVELRENESPMGICGLLKRDWLAHPDLGFAFLPEYSGQGFALEAAETILNDARERLGLEAVLAIVAPGNVASLRLLGKLGFSESGRVQPPDDAPPALLFSLPLLIEQAVDSAVEPRRRAAGMRG
jgi:RimJ/RimL family protein N-acetyltransferase